MRCAIDIQYRRRPACRPVPKNKREETDMEMKNFDEMKLVMTGDPDQDAAILEWLFLSVLVPWSFGCRPLVWPRP
ncbi:MAG: hypothetical protein V1782_09205 [Pseudomonadota bacterium]